MAAQLPPLLRRVAEHAVGMLAPATDLLDQVHTLGLAEALTHSLCASLSDPGQPARAAVRLAGNLAGIPLAAGARWLGCPHEPPVRVGQDRRFDDPAWRHNPAWYALRLAYLASAQFARDVLAGAPTSDRTPGKAELALDLLLDALAPTNFLATNPAALRRAFDTGGRSVAAGARNFLDDLRHNGGRPRQVDSSGFELGRNLAATPARVVYRNELMELLQYEPQTEQVYARPLLCSPPWINKYYVLDLAPGRSFIEWAVRHGRTVFAISYRNPTKDMAATTMDDYLVRGPMAALSVIRQITGADKIDLMGLCLGGALAAIAAAYLHGAGDSHVGTLTLLNTMLDYREPGTLSMFTDRRTLDRLEHRMRRDGTLASSWMATTFDLLRANDLIFNYLVSGWLMGDDPPAFDVLAWNADSTRMPAAMHAFYLRHFYLENRLASGTLKMAGRTIDLGAITTPTYLVSAVNDHIVPWEAAYRGGHLLGGPVRFVLTSGGHIAGVVSPAAVGPTRSWYRASARDTVLPSSGALWRDGSVHRVGSWWEDWARWSRGSAGPLRNPPSIGSQRYPTLGEGPGDYVLG